MIRLRHATPDDVPALAALEAKTFVSDAYPAFFFRQAVDLWPDWVRVAESGGHIAGSVIAAPALTAAEACLLSLAVSPSERGAGLGRALLDDLLLRLRADGVRLVWLTVHPSNPARRLYRRAGFLDVDEEADYFGPGEPRVRMERPIGD